MKAQLIGGPYDGCVAVIAPGDTGLVVGVDPAAIAPLRPGDEPPVCHAARVAIYERHEVGEMMPNGARTWRSVLSFERVEDTGRRRRPRPRRRRA